MNKGYCTKLDFPSFYHRISN